MDSKQLNDLRREYCVAGLDEKDMLPHPVAQFEAWFQSELKINTLDPNAMVLATCSAEGVPTARIVLLKEYDNRGFVFFTNYLSRKGKELAANPKATLLFYWAELERQVRIEGTVHQVMPEESDRYFASRPRGSRLGALASPQSEILPSKTELEAKVAELEQRYPNDDIPRPAHWGGYRLVPSEFEFWQGRMNRLHDRLVYRLQATTQQWQLLRLAP